MDELVPFYKQIFQEYRAGHVPLQFFVDVTVLVKRYLEFPVYVDELDKEELVDVLEEASELGWYVKTDERVFNNMIERLANFFSGKKTGRSKT